MLSSALTRSKDRACGLGVKEWAAIGEALGRCAALRELADFRWSRAVLAPGVADLDLERRELDDAQAAVLGALLPRTASALTALRLWWVSRDFLASWSRLDLRAACSVPKTPA